MKNILLLAFSTLLLMQCKSEKSSTDDQNVTTISEEPQGLPQERLNALISQTNVVDIIYYDLPMSMNQQESGSVRNTLTFIGPPIRRDSDACKPLARVSFMGNGELLEEADLYLAEQCKFFAFIENQKPVYYHQLSPNGVSFFTQVISQAQQQQ